MGVVVVNGTRVEVPDGSNVSVINGVIYIDDQPFGGDSKPTGVTKLVIEGAVVNIKTDRASVEVHGEVKGDVDAGGSVTCGNVGGKVSSGGSANCRDVNGNVSAGGSVNCGKVSGKVSAGGSVRMG
jgi:phage baseplate assembly protein gpV